MIFHVDQYNLWCDLTLSLSPYIQYIHTYIYIYIAIFLYSLLLVINLYGDFPIDLL